MNIYISLVFAAFSLCTMASQALAADATFAELIARAHAEVDAGKQWSPEGDNVAETLMAMLNLLPTATPQQLTEFDHLVSQQQSLLQHERSGRVATVSPPSLSAEPEKPASPPTPDTAPTTQAPPTAANSVNSARSAKASPASPPKPTGSTGRSTPMPAGQLAAEMLARGKDAEAHHDISQARRFYEVAAENDDAVAARALGRLYDPNRTGQMPMGGIKPNPELSQKWYQRADALRGDKVGASPETLSTR